jgi:hypothetical protein
MNSFSASYSDLNRSNSTYDDLEEERKRLKEEKNRIDESNLFKTRIIEAEINSSLRFQMLLYFHYFYLYLVVAINLGSSVHRLYIYRSKGIIPKLRVILSFVYFFEENLRIYFGYIGNLGESVKILIIIIINL